MSAVHELSLAQAVWEQAERVRRQHGGGRVVIPRVGVGDLSGVGPWCAYLDRRRQEIPGAVPGTSRGARVFLREYRV